jgi:hypothetical protein
MHTPIEVLQIAAILTHAHVVTHPPMSPDEQLDIYEHFVEQTRVIEAEGRAVAGNDNTH